MEISIVHQFFDFYLPLLLFLDLLKRNCCFLKFLKHFLLFSHHFEVDLARMCLQEVNSNLQLFRELLEILQGFKVSSVLIIVIFLPDVIENQGSYFGEVVSREVLVEDGELCEGSEEFGTLKLIKLVTELVVSCIQILHKLQLCYGASKEDLHNQVGVTLGESVINLNEPESLTFLFFYQLLNVRAALVDFLDSGEDALASQQVTDLVGNGPICLGEKFLHLPLIFSIFLSSEREEVNELGENRVLHGGGQLLLEGNLLINSRKHLFLDPCEGFRLLSVFNFNSRFKMVPTVVLTDFLNDLFEAGVLLDGLFSSVQNKGLKAELFVNLSSEFSQIQIHFRDQIFILEVRVHTQLSSLRLDRRGGRVFLAKLAQNFIILVLYLRNSEIHFLQVDTAAVEIVGKVTEGTEVFLAHFFCNSCHFFCLLKGHIEIQILEAVTKLNFPTFGSTDYIIEQFQVTLIVGKGRISDFLPFLSELNMIFIREARRQSASSLFILAKTQKIDQQCDEIHRFSVIFKSLRELLQYFMQRRHINKAFINSFVRFYLLLNFLQKSIESWCRINFSSSLNTNPIQRLRTDFGWFR